MTGANHPRIAVIGATARSGREIIRQALAAGYTVTGLARSPHKLDIRHERLTMVKGDVRDVESLKAAIGEGDIVISMVGKAPPSSPNEQIGQVDLYTVMAANLIEAMQAKGSPRLIMASSTGVEHRTDPAATEPDGPGMTEGWRFNARYLYHDMHEMEKMIAQSGLEYVLLRPGFLVEEPARHDVQFSLDGNTPPARTITYEDFAEFTLAQVSSDDYLNKAVGMYSEIKMDPAAEVKIYMEKLEREKAQQQQQQQQQ